MGTIPTGRRATALAVIALGLLLATTACTRDLSLDQWESLWLEANAELPAITDVAIDDPVDVCSEALGSVRRVASELIDAPNEDLAEAFLRWSDFTESVFFNCPPTAGNHVGFEASYEEMARLASEVEALLAFERGL